MEQSTEAPRWRQPQQLSRATVGAPDRDAAQCVQQRTVEQVVDDVGTEAQQRTVERVVEVIDETTATNPLDREPLDETQRVERSAVRAKAAPRGGSLSRAVRLEFNRVRYEQASAAKSAQERVLMNERPSDAVFSQGIGRTAGSPVRCLNALARPAVTNATPCLVVEYVAPVPAEHAATATVDEYVTGMVSSQNAMRFYSYLRESEKQCIDKTEPCVESKFRHEAETARLNEAPSVLSGGDSLIASALSQLRENWDHRGRIFWWLIARPPSYPTRRACPVLVGTTVASKGF